MRELQSLTLVYGNNAQTAHASDGYWLLAELVIPVFEEVIEYGAIVFKELFQSIEEGTSEFERKISSPSTTSSATSSSAMSEAPIFESPWSM